MIPNLKVDIIYYNTQSDFEMEFNLSGYCRMRIFKSAANTPEELINTLATDLDRSQIIIVVSDILGKDCGVVTVADAVGFELVSPNKEECGITIDEEIFIPKNAVPLVANSGSYGGCILESGEQSIIMITDNRALRHEIMKSLVHKYIFDVSQLDAYKKRKQIDEISVKENVEKASPHDSKAEESAQAGFSVPTPTETNIGNSIFSAPGTNLVINSNKAKTETSDDTEKPTPLSEDSPTKKRKNTSDILLLIIVILLLIAFGIMAYFFIYIPLMSGSLSLSDSDNGIVKAIETWLFN